MYLLQIQLLMRFSACVREIVCISIYLCVCVREIVSVYMKVILRHKDLHAYGKICESVHKTASANKICKRKRSFVKV